MGTQKNPCWVEQEGLRVIPTESVRPTGSVIPTEGVRPTESVIPLAPYSIQHTVDIVEEDQKVRIRILIAIALSRHASGGFQLAPLVAWRTERKQDSKNRVDKRPRGQQASGHCGRSGKLSRNPKFNTYPQINKGPI